MINHETELKLQAYLDGELSAGEAKAIADLLQSDAGAQGLYHELKAAKSLLVGNELERQLPESREFYGYQRSLETYRTVFGHDTTMILTTEGSFLHLLKGEMGARPAPAPAPPPTAAAAATASPPAR